MMSRGVRLAPSATPDRNRHPTVSTPPSGSTPPARVSAAEMTVSTTVMGTSRLALSANQPPTSTPAVLPIM